jgi:hypothetical protein
MGEIRLLLNEAFSYFSLQTRQHGRCFLSSDRVAVGKDDGMTDCQFFWYMLCQWTLVLATLVLAAIAIWGHIIRARFFGPRLCVELKKTKGEMSQFSDGVLSRYYHLRVWNDRRAAPAHNVRVAVKGVFRPSADGTMTTSPLSGPIQLVWQFQGSKPQFQTIGAESVCDLGYVRQGEHFRLSVLQHAISFNPILAPGERMIVCIAAFSDET